MKRIGKEEYCYFTEFINNSEYILASADMLRQTVSNYSVEKLLDNITIVHKLENEADKALHRMRNHLITDFLPPIDVPSVIKNEHSSISQSGISKVLAPELPLARATPSKNTPINF